MQSEYKSSNFVSTFTLAENSPFFSGHFPGTPILPGFRQLQLVRECVESNSAEKKITEFQNVKFLFPILPGKTFWIEIEMREHSADFLMKDSAQVITKGRFLLKQRVK